MALVIHLRKDGRVIINGAVIENVTGRAISIAVKNEASILRDNDVLQPEDATTPARRVYFALQCAYVFPESKTGHLQQAAGFLEAYLEAAHSAAPVVAAVRRSVEAGRLYEALKKARELLSHERGILARC